MVNYSGESSDSNRKKLYLTGKALMLTAMVKNGLLRRCIKQ